MDMTLGSFVKEEFDTEIHLADGNPGSKMY